MTAWCQLAIILRAGNFGSTGEPGIPGDANLDGVVSARRLCFRASEFRATSLGSQIVPEPLTISLLAIGLTVLSRRRR